jgi:hypothetical protein
MSLDTLIENYEIKEINGFLTLTKDGKYYGFVSEDTVIESDVGFYTLTDLVKYLDI